MSNIDKNKKEMIERYLLGQLSDEEQKQFKSNMDDPAFQEAYELQRDILETIEYRGDKRLKAMLVEEEEKIVALEQQKPKKIFYLLRVAAAAAAILLFAFIVWQSLVPKQQDLFAEYFKPQTNTLYPSVKSGEPMDEIMQTFLLYQNGDYEKALPGFEKILASQANDDISFYQANALLELGKTKEAISILQRVIQNNKTEYLAPTKWTLALAYVSQQKYSEAKTLLEEIKEDSFYKNKVERLLKESPFQR